MFKICMHPKMPVITTIDMCILIIKFIPVLLILSFFKVDSLFIDSKLKIENLIHRKNIIFHLKGVVNIMVGLQFYVRCVLCECISWFTRVIDLPTFVSIKSFIFSYKY